MPGQSVAGQRPRGDLGALVVVDLKVPVRELALTGALDPDLHPESLAGHNGRWHVPRDDIRRMRLDRERNRRRRFRVRNAFLHDGRTHDQPCISPRP